jgi:hypothetical protein
MDALNLIFSSYFQVVSYDFFVGIMAAIFCAQLVLTLVSHWDSII